MPVLGRYSSCHEYCPSERTLVSVPVHRFLTGSAALRTAEQVAPAVGADVALLLLLYPCLSAELTPRGNRPQYDFFPYGNRKIGYKGARKIRALVASFIPLFLSAGLDGALFAVLEARVRQAPVARYVFRGTPVHGAEPFLEFQVVVTVRHKHATNPTVQSAWSDKFSVDHAGSP